MEVIAIGTGPSFFEFIKTPRPEVPLVGCGVASNFINLDYYVFGDPVHTLNVPKTGIIFATIDAKKLIPGLKCHTYPDNLRHGGSSGGMAISLACSKYNHVGIVGFDGFQEPTIAQREWIHAQKNLFRYWIDQGKTFYSLMEESIFDDFFVKKDK